MKLTTLIALVLLTAAQAFSQTTPPSFQFGSSLDEILFNFSVGRHTVDSFVAFEFGSHPRVEYSVLEEGASVEQNIIDNLDFLKDRGFTRVSFTVVDGFGSYYFDSPLLMNMAHEGFDYDAQLADPTDPESDLAEGIDPRTAKQRYSFAGNWAPFFASEAHKRRLTFDLNFESLAHIISRAQGAGIGAEEGEQVIAGNLPLPSTAQIGTFLEELHAAILAYDPTITEYSISEEAYDGEYIAAIAETAARLGITHVHTGENEPGWGDIWRGYYYAFYPLDLLQVDIYRYVITLASTPAVVAQTFGAARTYGKVPRLVVGHYTPWPADPNLSIEDIYDPDRSEDVGPPIDNDNPLDRDGNPVATRTDGLQRNYLLYGLIAERATDFQYAVDLTPALEALAELDVERDVLPRLNEFAHALQETRPIVNVIVDNPADQGNDADTADNEISDFSTAFAGVVEYGLAETMYASIHAAGMEAWVTFNEPMEDRDIAAYWIITAGGGETIEEEESSEAPPYWTNADDLDPVLLDLIDPTKTGTPVIVSTMAGLANTENWTRVREIFGIPTGRGGTETGPAYASRNLIDLPEYQTSLASNFLSDSDGEAITTDEGEPLTADILPETVNWGGMAVRLRGVDPSSFGIVANVIHPDEVPTENALLASSRTDSSDALIISDPDDTGTDISTTSEPCVYIFRNGADGKKILINPNIYHLDMTYPLSNILCDITGRARSMNRPTTAYISVGETTAVFAVDDTTVDLSLPIEGDGVRFDKFDRSGNWVVQSQIVSRTSLFPLELGMHELAIFRAAGTTGVAEWEIVK